MRTADRRLMWHGMFLFLFGLVTGQQERRFSNMRMALSAHLQGVLNGTFLIALGAIWDHVELPPRAEKVARLSALYGTYGNWLFTTLGAAMGTAAANPILSQGHHGKPWQERAAGWGLSQHRLFDPCRRGADPLGSWSSANSASHSCDSARCRHTWCIT
jgi:hydroxylaminobenzene mutase